MKTKYRLKKYSLSLTLKADDHLNEWIIKKYYNDEQFTTKSWCAILTKKSTTALQPHHSSHGAQERA